jgi:citrate/tricarballylate utilization protein
MPPKPAPDNRLAHGSLHLREGERIMLICNACRYCEGYCDVFPAMERRMNFTSADIDYLANLCHNCAECYYACQYAPPHEFSVNVPRVFAEIRAESYLRYTWPTGVALFFRSRGIVLAWLPMLAVLLWSVAHLNGTAFYDVIPHNRIIALFVMLSAFILVAHISGFLRFWKGIGGGRFLEPGGLIGGIRDALTLKNLGSRGAGCTYPDEKHSHARRTFHHLTLYGFLLCFASTTVAAIYDNFFGWIAPYDYLSLPVILGALGGIGLLIGPAGLYSLKQRRDPAIADPKQDGQDVGFLMLLFLTSFTGFLLLGLRDTPQMGVLLVVHLAVVLALFLTLPYGKFVHGIYRAAALVRNALEQAGEKQ